MADDASSPLLLPLQFGTASAFKTFGNIVVSIVGTGVLGLPYTFRISGWAVAASAVLISALLTYYCMMLLVKCRNKLEEQGHLNISTYGDLGYLTYGSIGKNLVDLMVLTIQSGCCVAYLIFIGQNISSIFTSTTITKALCILILVPFQMILAWVRSLSGLAPFSIFADVCNLLATAVVIKDDLLSFQGFDGIIAFRKWSGLPFAMGVAVYSFEGFGMTLTLQRSMKNPQNFGKVLASVIIVITIFYMGFGLIGYFAFREDTEEIVTLNLPNDWSTIAVKVGLCIALFFTFPVMMYPVHEIAERKVMVCGFLQRRLGSHPRLYKLLFDALRSAIVLLIALIAVAVPGFAVFISLVGSTVCAMLSFVFPASIHLHVYKHCTTFIEWVIDWFLLIAGITFALYGTYTTVIDIFG